MDDKNPAGNDNPVFDDSLEAFADALPTPGLNGTNGKNQPAQFTLTRLQALEKPALEEELIEPGGSGPGGCSCNAVCVCVPVETCSCNTVCTCDTVNTCPSNITPCGCNIVFWAPCG